MKSIDFCGPPDIVHNINVASDSKQVPHPCCKRTENWKRKSKHENWNMLLQT